MTTAAQAEEPAEEDARLHHVRAVRLRETLYGTLVLLSVLAYLADQGPDAVECLWTVGGTAVTLYVAQVYSTRVAYRIVASPDAKTPGLRMLAGESWPVAAVAVPSMLFLAISAAGAFTVATALQIDTWLSLAGLTACTYAAARAAHTGKARRLASTTASLLLGLVIVALKAAF